MRRRPRLISATAIVGLLVVFLVPVLLASGAAAQSNDNGCRGVPQCHWSVQTYPIVVVNHTAGIHCPDGSAPPCNPSSASLGSGAGIPVGGALLGVGGLWLGYLWIHRRRTLELKE